MASDHVGESDKSAERSVDRPGERRGAEAGHEGFRSGRPSARSGAGLRPHPAGVRPRSPGCPIPRRAWLSAAVPVGTWAQAVPAARLVTGREVIGPSRAAPGRRDGSPCPPPRGGR